MKKPLLSSLLILVSTLTLIACSPEDRKIERSNSGNNRTSAQGQTGSFKVGTFGQTIWVAQNLEQVGRLIQACLDFKSGELQNPGSEGETKSLSCKVELNPAGDMFSQLWNLNVQLIFQHNLWSPILAYGEIAHAWSMVNYNRTRIFMRYDNLQFKVQYENENLKVTLTGGGDLGSNSENLKFDNQFSAEGKIEDGQFVVSTLLNRMVLLTTGQIFLISTEDLKVRWNTSRACEDSAGTFKVQEKGLKSSAAEIKLANGAAVQASGTWKKNGIRRCVEPDIYNLFY